MIGESLVSQPGLNDCDSYGKQGTCPGFPVGINAKSAGVSYLVLSINARHLLVFPSVCRFTTDIKCLDATSSYFIAWSCITSSTLRLLISLTVFLSLFVFANAWVAAADLFWCPRTASHKVGYSRDPKTRVQFLSDIAVSCYSSAAICFGISTCNCTGGESRLLLTAKDRLVPAFGHPRDQKSRAQSLNDILVAIPEHGRRPNRKLSTPVWHKLDTISPISWFCDISYRLYILEENDFPVSYSAKTTAASGDFYLPQYFLLLGGARIVLSAWLSHVSCYACLNHASWLCLFEFCFFKILLLQICLPPFGACHLKSGNLFS